MSHQIFQRQRDKPCTTCNIKICPKNKNPYPINDQNEIETLIIEDDFFKNGCPEDR